MIESVLFFFFGKTGLLKKKNKNDQTNETKTKEVKKYSTPQEPTQGSDGDQSPHQNVGIILTLQLVMC